MAGAPKGYYKSVFINAPFSAERREIFDAIVFTVQACGFSPHCALEFDNAAQSRLEKIKNLIRDCHLGVHDISYMALDIDLPRFNMPFELGLFLGAAHYAEGWASRKVCTILDAEPYRYQRAISDISGQDIRTHGLDPQVASAQVRDWLSHHGRQKAPILGSAEIWRLYRVFAVELPAIAEAQGLTAEDLTFRERRYIAGDWLARVLP